MQLDFRAMGRAHKGRVGEDEGLQACEVRWGRGHVEAKGQRHHPVRQPLLNIE
jgi:hypothetical protein